MENKEHARCGRCNRPLKTDKSRADGYGPVCKAKVAAEDAMMEQQKADFDE